MSPCENIFDRMHAHYDRTLNTCHYISIIFLPGNGYSRDYKKVWGINNNNISFICMTIIM